METRVCPSCQKALPSHVPLGLCPECLIKSGFETGTGPGSRGTGFTPPRLNEIQSLFPQLEVIELIGQGGMGAVYKARQPGLDRFVALKVLPPHAAGGTQGFAERFNREARALARLSHPRIVTVHDFGVAGDLHYLIMEYVDGANLRQVERNGRLTPEQALQLVPQICEALQFAHDQGIVHRDIKPENLLLDKDGNVKITDFGIAKMVGIPADKTSLTGVRDIVGTPHYMAPEQIENPMTVDHRADIFSLGVVFYEMLTGELPLGRFDPPSQRVQMDVRLDEVVLRSLEKQRDRRYQQAGQLKTHVETIAKSPGAGSVYSGSRRPIGWVPAVVLYSLQAVLVVVAEWMLVFDNPEGFFSLGFLSLLALIPAYVVWGLLHYRCWKTLPERYRATTPGRAVGLMFVPLFNFFWAFISFPKLARGFNAWRENLPELPTRDVRTLGIWKAVLFVCFWTIAWIPLLGGVFCVADSIVFGLYYRGITHNANLAIRPALPRLKSA
jgi:predicted Ser/Thr protein kinase